jgi:hypothetical protein
MQKIALQDKKLIKIIRWFFTVVQSGLRSNFKHTLFDVSVYASLCLPVFSGALKKQDCSGSLPCLQPSFNPLIHYLTLGWKREDNQVASNPLPSFLPFQNGELEAAGIVAVYTDMLKLRSCEVKTQCSHRKGPNEQVGTVLSTSTESKVHSDHKSES